MQFNKIFILGSNSFTGGHFIDHVLKNSTCEIVGISRSPEYNPIFLPFLYEKERPNRYTFYQIDINRNMEEIFRLCDDFKPEVVVNFAAQGMIRIRTFYPVLEWEFRTLGKIPKISGASE